MRLWARARRLPLILGVLVGLGILLRFGGGHAVMMPTVIGGGGGAILWSTFLPLFWAGALCAAFDSVGSPAEQRPRRHLRRFDAALFLTATLSFAGTMAVADNPNAWRQVLAHALVLGGLATTVTVARGAGAGALAATTVVLVTSSYSPYLDGAAYVRFLQPQGDLGFATLLGAALCLLALTALTGRLGAVRRISERQL